MLFLIFNEHVHNINKTVCHINWEKFELLWDIPTKAYLLNLSITYLCSKQHYIEKYDRFFDISYFIKNESSFLKLWKYRVRTAGFNIMK